MRRSTPKKDSPSGEFFFTSLPAPSPLAAIGIVGLGYLEANPPGPARRCCGGPFFLSGPKSPALGTEP